MGTGNAIKTVKHSGVLCQGYAKPVVFDDNRRTGCTVAARYAHGNSGATIAKCVVKQVGNHLFEQCTIAPHLGAIVIRLEAEVAP